MRKFIEAFTGAAQAAGLGRLEFYAEELLSRSVYVSRGELDRLDRGHQRSVYIRGALEGLEGSVFVEDPDPAHFSAYIEAIRQSAQAGGAAFKPWTLPQLPPPEEGGNGWLPLPEVMERLTSAEGAALNCDHRIEQVERCVLRELERTITLADSEGHQVSDRLSGGQFGIGVVARQGNAARSAGQSAPFRQGQCPDLRPIAERAAMDAAGKLETALCPSGVRPAVLDSKVVCELLDAFLPAFYTKNVQNHMSTLSLGRRMAAEEIVIGEDPALAGGLNSRRFDDMGAPTAAKVLVSGGRLQALLDDQAGNAFKPGISESASTGYTNIYLRPGSRSQGELLQAMGDGLLITGVSGVFAGASFSSGEFSLISQGYLVRGGQRREGVSQITISGNFYDLLQRVRGVGSDSRWMRAPAGCLQAPSLWVGGLSISGKEETL